jgi:hypothetical protein
MKMVNTLFFFFSFFLSFPFQGRQQLFTNHHHPLEKKTFLFSKFPTIFSFSNQIANGVQCVPRFKKNSTVSQGRPLHSELEKTKMVFGRALAMLAAPTFSDLSN